MWILFVIIGIYAFILAFGVLELLFFILPIKSLKNVYKANPIDPPSFYVKSFVFHIHTQFSYDSLGKPEDIEMSRKEEAIDYVIITDHENTHYKCFENEHIVVGKEEKITNENGIVGSLISVDELKVVAHPFKKKYIWRLEKTKDLVVELIDLRDAVIKSKYSMFWRYIGSIIPKIFLKKRIYRFFSPALTPEFYVKKYFEQGWKNPVIGGLDHHVKIYVREVGIRLLIPSYKWSFGMLRNFAFSKSPIKTKKDIIENIKKGNTVISFVDRPSFFFEEEDTLFAYLPYENSFSILYEEGMPTKTCLGSYGVFQKPKKPSFIIAYSFMFNIKNIYFGVRPIAISNIILP
ncbi:PHP domain-containing protein [Hydrogenobaculum acidophilum]